DVDDGIRHALVDLRPMILAVWVPGVSRRVRTYRDRIASPLSSRGVHRRHAVVDERPARVAGAEPAGRLLLPPVAAPAVVHAVPRGLHAAPAAGVDQERHPSPRLGMRAVLDSGPDHL